MDESKISFIPIGGLGEIGRNMILFRGDESSFIVDAGVQFPNDTPFNLKFLVSDYKKYIDRRVKDLIITHAHEDHIGAIHFLLQDFPHLNIHAGPFAAELIKHKLAKFNIKSEKKIFTYSKDSVIEIGQFRIHPFPVNHSIPETNGLFISHEKSKTALFYISDFKVDQNPLFEPPFDLKNLKSLGKKYTHKYLFIDSTNVLSDDKNVVTERETASNLKKIIKKNSKKRIFITLFASNLHRIKAIYQIAKAEKRPLFTVGKSLDFFVSVGKKCGIFHSEDEILEYDNYNPNKDHHPIFLLTGCQGDFKGAVNRIAYRQDVSLKLDAKDLFIFSSKTIPGNEYKVNKIINELSKSEVEIITAHDENIHSSGHASKKDIHDVIKNFAPTHLVPIHGEYFFLKRHFEYLKEKYPQTKTLLVNNEDELQISLSKHKYAIEKFAQDPQPLLVLDHDVYIDKKDLSVKRKLALYGSLFITLDLSKRKILGLTLLGVTPPIEKNKFEAQFINKIEHMLSKEKFSVHVKDKEKVYEDLRIKIQRTFKEFNKEKTLITLHLIA